MAESTFNPASADDGRITSNTANKWVDARATSASCADNETSLYATVVRGGGAGAHTLRRAWLVFDTSSLPDGAVINSATLRLYVSAVEADGSSIAAGSYSITEPVCTNRETNWDAISGGLSNGGSRASCTASQYNEITLGTAIVNKTGDTVIAVWENTYDAADSGPAKSTAYGATFDSTDGTNKPELVVDYTSAITATANLAAATATAQQASTTLGARTATATLAAATAVALAASVTLGAASGTGNVAAATAAALQASTTLEQSATANVAAASPVAQTASITLGPAAGTANLAAASATAQQASTTLGPRTATANVAAATATALTAGSTLGPVSATANLAATSAVAQQASVTLGAISGTATVASASAVAQQASTTLVYSATANLAAASAVALTADTTQTDARSYG